MARNRPVPNGLELSEQSFSAALARLFVNASLLDLGCGVGAYGRYFRQHAPTVQWTGVDGSEGIEEYTKQLVRFADLAADGLPRTLRRPWDWTLSVQVAEHIPPRAEPAFMHTLAVHAQRGVVLQWAHLGQHGLMHANCQSPRYVACAMRFLGFDAASHVDREIENVVFLRRSSASRLPEQPDAGFVAAYRNATRRHCEYTTWGYLTGSARTIRQLASHRAALGVPMRRRVCDADGGQQTNWRRELNVEAKRVALLASASGENGQEVLLRHELELFEALAVDEVSPYNRHRIQNLSTQTFAPPGSGAAATSSVLPALSGQNASIEWWLMWLNNTVWGLCVPPRSGFCFFSRAAKTWGRSKRPRVDCAQ